MAQALLYNIKVTSNWAQVMTKDTAATNSNTKSKVANTAADKAADSRRTESTGIMSSVFRMIGMNTDATDKSTASKKRNWYIQRLLNKSTKTAGFNVGGLSLRIHESLVPAMAVLYTSMLPVIAGLLAIGSAAIVAVGGIAGVAAIGLLGWSKQYKDAQESGGFAGGRQPLGLGTGGQGDFMSEVMSGFTGFMDHPAVKLAIDWTEDLFKTTLPNAFKIFLDNVDLTSIKGLLQLFTEWLPDAAKGMAQWGNKIYNAIGPKSLKMINDVFKWIAAGLISVAGWLQLEGFNEIESLGKNIADFAGSLMQLGKEVLPLLNEALKAIYPNPIKPVMDQLTKLFGAIGENENSVEVLKKMTQLFAALLVLKGIEATLSGLIWFFTGLKHLMPVIAYFTGGAGIAAKIATGAASLISIPATVIVILGLIGAGILLWVMTLDNIVSKAIKWWFTNLGTLFINGLIGMFNLVKAELSLIPGIDFEQTAYRQYTGFDGEGYTGTQVVESVITVILETDTDMISAKVLDEAGNEINTVTGINKGLNTAPGGF